MRYQDKVVVVTGAGRGIGRVIADMYVRHGATVVLIDKDHDQLNQTSSLFIETGYDVTSYVVDLNRPEEIVICFSEIKAKLGRVDILINNAGMSFWKSPYEISVEEWDKILGTNLRGTFLCAREAASLMKTQGGGVIVNIASTRALMSEPNSEAYAASKGGIVSLTHALAVSLGPDRIRVNVISPGWIETGDYAQLKKSDHLQHPAMRVGKPEDVARACLYLTDPENDFITGINLVLDGGMTRKMIYDE